MAEAFSALGDTGGKIVLCGKTTLDADLAPAAHTGAVTLTMFQDGTDYRASGAELYFTGRHSLFFAGAVKFVQFTFHIAETAFLFAQWHPLEMGEDITVRQYKSGNGMYLIGGTQSGREDTAVRDGAPHLIVRSGRYHTITPYSRQIKATFTGDAVIDAREGMFTVCKDASVTYKPDILGSAALSVGTYGTVSEARTVVIDGAEADGIVGGADTLDVEICSGKVGSLQTAATAVRHAKLQVHGGVLAGSFTVTVTGGELSQIPEIVGTNTKTFTSSISTNTAIPSSVKISGF